MTTIRQTQVYLAGVCIGVVLFYYVYSFVRPTPKRKTMKISDIYVYPIKSLRPTSPQSALGTKYGLEHDRTFMLLQKLPSGEYSNMAVSRFPEMTRFFPSLDMNKSIITVTYKPVDPSETSCTLEIPLKPDTEKLKPFDIDMHTSSTRAFQMPTEHSQWFSSCFGYDVIFVYIGENRRDVLFRDMVASSKTGSWLPSVLSKPNVPPAKHKITLADCAPYLVVSKTSLGNVSDRLPEGEDMDITKFRPNIVLDGAEEAWEEDYWRRVKINGGAEIELLQNCVRCMSVNIDYDTGKPGTGESGQVLKKLQKDRRVDMGMKWSPVFGRYGFWEKNGSQMLRVGDEVQVAEMAKERTVFSWPGL